MEQVTEREAAICEQVVQALGGSVALLLFALTTGRMSPVERRAAVMTLVAVWVSKGVLQLPSSHQPGNN